jgi:hypothetical protein
MTEQFSYTELRAIALLAQDHLHSMDRQDGWSTSDCIAQSMVLEVKEKAETLAEADVVDPVMRNAVVGMVERRVENTGESEQ